MYCVLSIFFKTIITEMNNSNQNLLTILQNNKDIEEKFKLRQKLYEHRDIISEQNQGINDSILESLENKEEYIELKKNIQKGKELLVQELHKHKELALKNIEINEFETITKSLCSECVCKLTLLKTYFQNHTEVVDELQDYIDGIYYSLQQITDLINKTVETKNNIIKNDIIKNTAIIKYMADTFHTIKESQFGHICPICLTSEVNIFCDPCGHSFCNKCITNSQYCYMCRLKINKIRQLYFP